VILFTVLTGTTYEYNEERQRVRRSHADFPTTAWEELRSPIDIRSAREGKAIEIWLRTPTGTVVKRTAPVTHVWEVDA
jgi:hypothetical protein